MTARQGYTPPTVHRGNTIGAYPNPTIQPDGWPANVQSILYGSDDTENGEHIGGYPDISRETADRFVAERKLEAFEEGRIEEPAWGAGFTLVRDRVGEPHLLVGPDESPSLIRLALIPDRVREGMGELGGLWLATVPLPAAAPTSSPAES